MFSKYIAHDSPSLPIFLCQNFPYTYGIFTKYFSFNVLKLKFYVQNRSGNLVPGLQNTASSGNPNTAVPSTEGSIKEVRFLNTHYYTYVYISTYQICSYICDYMHAYLHTYFHIYTSINAYKNVLYIHTYYTHWLWLTSVIRMYVHTISVGDNALLM